MEMERPNATNALGSNTKRPRAMRNGSSHSFGAVRSTTLVSSTVAGVQEHKENPKGEPVLLFAPCTPFGNRPENHGFLKSSTWFSAFKLASGDHDDVP